VPLKFVSLIPGVNSEQTPTLGQAKIIASQLIRFRYAGDQALVEKLGGWQKYYSLSFGSAVRALKAWEGISADKHLGVGCETSLDVITGATAIDITPRTETTNPAVDFTTTMGSAEVSIVDAGFTTSAYDSIYLETPVSVGGIVLYGSYEITSTTDATTYVITAASDATSSVSDGGAVPVFTTTSGTQAVSVQLDNHGQSIGNIFPVATPTTVGGLTLGGAYLVQKIIDADNFVIYASSSATSSASASMNGGNAQIVYYVGIQPSGPPLGYGEGTYGDGAYGTGVVPPADSGSPITTSNWTLDNWGEILMACPADGAVYTWSPDSGFQNAIRIVNAPIINGGIFVAAPYQILVAWASTTNGVQDPLLVQWSDSGDFTDWTVSALTQAGNFRIPTGSRIVGGMMGPQFAIIWTDIDVWAMDYIQPPLVFGFNKLADHCGLIGRHAMCSVNTQVYWMGLNQFYTMSGGNVTPIPCPVWDYVFQNLDTNNLDKITCAPNNSFGEVAWYFPSQSGGTGEIDSYVKFNFILNAWDVGKLQRTAWIDQSVLGEPIGGDASGYVYQHEVSPNADGQPMQPSFTTGYFELDEGDFLSFVDWLIPDFRYGTYAGSPTANLQLSLTYTNYPNETPLSAGPYNIVNTTTTVTLRLRARQVAITIGSSDLNSFWRLGGIRFRIAPAGRR
jgi:hypothetical protein